MDYTVRLGAGKAFVETRVYSPVTEDLALRSQADANKLAIRHNLKRFLVDVRDISTETDAVGDVIVAKELPQTGLPLKARIAVLVSPNDNQHDFIETTAQNRGIMLQVFNDEDAAVAWLSR